jgi:thymidine kinase
MQNSVSNLEEREILFFFKGVEGRDGDIVIKVADKREEEGDIRSREGNKLENVPITSREVIRKRKLTRRKAKYKYSSCVREQATVSNICKNLHNSSKVVHNWFRVVQNNLEIVHKLHKFVQNSASNLEEREILFFFKGVEGRDGDIVIKVADKREEEGDIRSREGNKLENVPITSREVIRKRKFCFFKRG